MSKKEAWVVIQTKFSFIIQYDNSTPCWMSTGRRSILIQKKTPIHWMRH